MIKPKHFDELIIVVEYLFLSIKELTELISQIINTNKIDHETETKIYFFEDMFYQNLYIFFEKLALFLEEFLDENDKNYLSGINDKESKRKELLKRFEKIDKNFSKLVREAYKEATAKGFLDKRRDFTHKFLNRETLSQKMRRISAMFEALKAPFEKDKKYPNENVEKNLSDEFRKERMKTNGDIYNYFHDYISPLTNQLFLFVKNNILP